MTHTTMDTVLAGLSQVSTSGNGYTACCPVHNDTNPSLQIWAGDYKPVLAKCYACDAREDAVLVALGIDPTTNRYAPGERPVAPVGASTAIVASRYRPAPVPTVPAQWEVERAKSAPPASPMAYSPILFPYVRGGELSTPVAAYHYNTVTGEYAYTVVRYSPKTFRQFTFNEAGEAVMGFKDVRREIYNAPIVRNTARQGNWVVFVDGEKDADVLNASGYVATCIAGGGKGTYPDNISEMLDSCKLAIVVDKDQAGLESAKRLYDTVREHVVQVKFVVLPNHPEYFIKDVADYFNAGYTHDEFITCVNNGLNYTDFMQTYYPNEEPTAEEGAVGAATEATTGVLPQVLLPAGHITYTQSATALGGLMAATGRYFNRGGTLVRVDRSRGLGFKEVTSKNLQSAFESVATLVKMTDDGPVPTICSNATADAIMHAEAFMAPMPEVKGISKVPVLVLNEQGKLVATTGYCPISKMYSEGATPELMPVGQAVAIINEALSDFKFSSAGDKARAIAAILTPAAIRGGILRGRAPFDLGEADGSQAGKSYRHKLTAAMYNERVDVITQGNGRGLGNVEEAISAKLLAGSGFISIDNMRGKLDSPMIEAMATEDTILCRVAYSAPQTVDPSKVTLQATSNRADITRDLANRSSVVRIRHQGFDYTWRQYPEGDILDHIRGNQHKYYGAIYTILNAWVEAGRPQDNVTDHSFKVWAGSLGWIVRTLFNAGDILAGHREIQERLTIPHMRWIREVAIAAVAGLTGPCTEALRTSDLLELCLDNDIEVPGLGDRDNPDDDNTRKRVLQTIGRRMGRVIAKGTAAVDIDGYRIYRRDVSDAQYRTKSAYLFEPITATTPPLPTAEAPVVG